VNINNPSQRQLPGYCFAHLHAEILFHQLHYNPSTISSLLPTHPILDLAMTSFVFVLLCFDISVIVAAMKTPSLHVASAILEFSGAIFCTIGVTSRLIRRVSARTDREGKHRPPPIWVLQRHLSSLQSSTPKAT
ncbi:hypothetical protein TSMEX_007940, partial [Taenia solium]